jgi:hypothetical protein
MRPRSLVPAIALLALSQGGAAPLTAKAPGTTRSARAGSGESLWTQMRNVHMVVDPAVILEVRELHGRLVAARKGGIPFFDDPKSFRIEIDRATTAISTASMSALLNRYTFAYPGAPLKNIELSVHDGKLRQKGTLHKGADVPFEMDGELSALPDGRLKVHPTALKVAGLPVKRLLDALGVELVKVIKVRADRGVAIDGDDLLLDANQLLPPPAISGRVGAARLERDRIVLEFVGPAPKALKPSLPEARNYMYFRGGRLRFGKLTMQDTDLQIVDTSPDDSFRFDLSQYARQLVAGYSKTMTDKGLVSFMPDADKVDRPVNP